MTPDRASAPPETNVDLPAPLPRGYESVESLLLTEPRIDAIRREIVALLRVVQMESEGKPMEIDGFRLRDVGAWADYPTSLSEIFWHLSSVCNFSCEFCYEKGNPEGFPIQDTPRMATPEEIATRLRHYDPVRRTGIFSVRTSINEPFANRRAIEYLREMRVRAPDELLSFVTNGFYLDRPVVEALSKLKPLFLNLSLYSTDDQIRKKVLRDPRGAQTLRAAELLREYRVPYMSNLVMWPSVPFEDMERSIAFLQANASTVVRVCLGGYTRYLKGDFKRFTVESFWPRVVEAVESIRERFDVPILIEPNSYVCQDTVPRLDGVIVGSPAARAGLRRGDVVVAINGRRVYSRMEMQSALRREAERDASFRAPGVQIGPGNGPHVGERTVLLDIEQDGVIRRVALDRYAPEAMASESYASIADFDDFIFGLVVTDSLRFSSLLYARDLLEARRPERTLLLSSVLMEPIVRGMIDLTHALDRFQVDIEVALNHYFGGTINIGDLLVVEDFIAAIEDYTRRNGRPNLVLIPASPFACSPWTRDLTGRPYTDIERATGVPVELLPCANITF